MYSVCLDYMCNYMYATPSQIDRTFLMRLADADRVAPALRTSLTSTKGIQF